MERKAARRWERGRHEEVSVKVGEVRGGCCMSVRAAGGGGGEQPVERSAGGGGGGKGRREGGTEEGRSGACRWEDEEVFKERDTKREIIKLK